MLFRSPSIGWSVGGTAGGTTGETAGGATIAGIFADDAGAGRQDYETKACIRRLENLELFRSKATTTLKPQGVHLSESFQAWDQLLFATSWEKVCAPMWRSIPALYSFSEVVVMRVAWSGKPKKRGQGGHHKRLTIAGAAGRATLTVSSSELKTRSRGLDSQRAELCMPSTPVSFVYRSLLVSCSVHGEEGLVSILMPAVVGSISFIWIEASLDLSYVDAA